MLGRGRRKKNGKRKNEDRPPKNGRKKLKIKNKKEQKREKRRGNGSLYVGVWVRERVWVELLGNV